MWYRHFLPPSSGPQQTPPFVVSLLTGPLSGSLDDYAQTYLARNVVSESHDQERQGVPGKSFAFASADGSMRYSLLLLKDDSRVVGLYAQGGAPAFTQSRAILDEMAKSFTFERAAAYPEVRNAAFRLSVRIPPSWAESRRITGGKTFLAQYISPPLGAEKGGQTVHASLTLTVEEIGGDGTLEAFYGNTRLKLGTAFDVIGHQPWKDGYVDVMAAETPMATSRVKRFYRAAGGRGYSLTFEAREDVYSRVGRWCDLIAGTLRVGPELQQPQ